MRGQKGSSGAFLGESPRGYALREPSGERVIALEKQSSGLFFAGAMVGRGGFEPPTSRLSSARSNQLSYQPKSDVSSKAVSARPSADRHGSQVRTFETTTEGMRGRRHGCREPASVVRVTERRPSEEGRTVHILRKEVIQPQVPLRLPCYDFTPVADLTVVGCLRS